MPTGAQPSVQPGWQPRALPRAARRRLAGLLRRSRIGLLRGMDRKAWAERLPLRSVLAVALVLLVVGVVIVGAVKWYAPQVAAADNLLANRTPMRAVEVVRTQVLTDGVRAEDGGS